MPTHLPSAAACSARVADPALSARLDLEAGGRISVGDATFEIRGVLRNEPDKLAGGIGFGPRLLISDAGLRATGLVQPGSLVRWLYRVKLPDNDATDRAAAALVSDAAKAIAGSGLGNPHRAATPRPRSNAMSSASPSSSRWSD